MGIVSEGRVRFVPPWTSALTRMLEVGGKMSQLLLPVQQKEAQTGFLRSWIIVDDVLVAKMQWQPGEGCSERPSRAAELQFGVVSHAEIFWLRVVCDKWRDGSNSVWTCWTPCSSGQLVTGTVLRLGPESHTLMQCRINARRWSQPTFVPDKAAFIHFPWAGSVQHNRPKQLIQKQEVIFVNWHGQVFNPGPFLQES